MPETTQAFKHLFGIEAEQRLESLEGQLLQLEGALDPAALVASIFRDAHTLKGGAGVVGLHKVASLAHAMEEVLEELRSGRRSVSTELVDVLLRAVDLLRDAIPRAIEGDDSAPALDAVLADIETLQASPHQDASHEIAPPAAVPGSLESGAHIQDKEAVAPDEQAGPIDRRETADADHASAPADGTVDRVRVDRLDELVRLVGEAAAAHLRVGRMLGEQLRRDPSSISEFLDLARVINELQDKTMRARMIPVSTLTGSLSRSVRDTARDLGKDVRWEVRGGDTELDRKILEALADPLLHVVRNAVDHGIESPSERSHAGKDPQATLRLHAMQLGSEVIIAISDDGRGIDVDRVRRAAERRGDDVSQLSDDEVLYTIFRSGLSTTEFVTNLSGRGVGLDVVRTALESVRGRVEVRTQPGAGTEFRLAVPITLALLPCLIVEVAQRPFAIPMHSVVAVQAPGRNPDETEGASSFTWLNDRAVPLASLAETLGIEQQRGHGPLVIITSLTRRHGFFVDGFVRLSDVVVKGLGNLLPRLDVLIGASVEPDGSILPVLDAPGLIEKARARRNNRGTSSSHPASPSPSKLRILVVDDALTVRELQRSILERAGYQVRLASDGAGALAALAEEPFDLVLTDVEMPKIDGFTLCQRIREKSALTGLPVVILTSRGNEEDRQRGLEVGADAYIVKSGFDESALLGVVERLLGRAA